MKKVYYDLLIEMIAVFFGVTIAFFIDDYRESKSVEKKTAEYFAMLRNELSKDTLDFNRNEEVLLKESGLIEKLINALDKGHYIEFELRMKNFGGDDIFHAQADLIEHILESPDFVTIYEQKLFSKLSDLKEDCGTYNLAADEVAELQESIRDECLKNSIEGGTVSKEKTNHLIFLLYKYDQAIKNKMVLNGSVKEEYLDCIGVLMVNSTNRQL